MKERRHKESEKEHERTILQREEREGVKRTEEVRGGGEKRRREKEKDRGHERMRRREERAR